MQTVDTLKHLIENYEILVYLFIVVGLLFEGEFILISLGILLHLHILNIYATLLFIVLGLFLKTFLGYYVGVFISNNFKHIRLVRYIEKRVSEVMPHFKRRPFWSIFISKFILGVNNIVILFTGYHKINFKKYIKAEFYSTVLWAPGLVFVGYIFSYTALRMSQEVWRFSLIVLCLVVAFIALDKFVSWAYEIFEEFYHNHNNHEQS